MVDKSLGLAIKKDLLQKGWKRFSGENKMEEIFCAALLRICVWYS